MSESADLTAWLVRRSGPLAGMRFPVGQSITTVGRGAQNDVSLADSPMVSVRHLEIRKHGSDYKLYDLNSTNGTFVDGERVVEVALKPSCNIQLGDGGPELIFLLETTPQVDMDRTIDVRRESVFPAGAARPPDKDRLAGEHEDLLIEAVAKSHLTRQKGIGDQTLILMRQTMLKAMHRTRRKFVKIIVALVILLVGLSAFGAWKIRSLKVERNRIDSAIRSIEARLQETNPNQPEASALYERLNEYEDKAKSLEGDLLYRVTVHTPVDPLEQEIKGLLAEFGAETYTVPSEFLEQTKRFIEQYQGSDRPNIEHGLGEARKQIDTMRAIFEQEHLPPDLAYMSIVESSLSLENRSRAGAAGLWQFTQATARAYGLNVSQTNDERLDTRKSTHAACKYMRELILDFGAGSSVMLALAAYNGGPSKVKQAIRRVTDPIKQRNFWYLYRVRALPEETREYVPKVIAVLIIARHPERFGF
jgi:pSer/pThr/pTyr-binding forkhead associated (FHA) protein